MEMNDGVIPYNYFVSIQKDNILGENPLEVGNILLSHILKYICIDREIQKPCIAAVTRNRADFARVKNSSSHYNLLMLP